MDSPSLSTLAGQVAIEGALSAKPKIVVESAPVVKTTPQKQALPNDPYPLLYTEKISPKEDDSNEKIAYLTFDDGPSDLTIPLLDVLDRYQVKATFFLVGKTGEEDRKAMREIVKRGHAIAVHSYSHDYREIYASVDAYLADFAKMHDLILKETGVDTPLYRFAGGSINSYNRDTAKAIIEEMNRRGYTYFDWNVDSGDATRGTTAQQIYQHAVNDSKQFRRQMCIRDSPTLPSGDLLGGMLNRNVGRELLRVALPQLPKTAGQFSKGQLGTVSRTVKNFRFPVVGLLSWDSAQVTAGGVPLAEVDCRTMESRKCRGVYLTGELLNVDGDCGGYNLHWAWSTGMAAGRACARSLLNGMPEE